MRRCWIILLICLAAARPASALRADDVDDDALAKVTAAFLLNFSRYSEWPEDRFGDAADPVVLAVVGRSPVTPYLRAIVADERVGGRSFAVRVIPSPEEGEAEDFVEALRGAHLVYVPRDERRWTDEVIRATWNRGVLTASEDRDFVEEGGAFELYVQRGRMVFDVNREAIDASRVQVSSKVLRLAQRVEGTD